LEAKLIENQKGQKVTQIMISNPEDLPEQGRYLSIEEPIAKVEIITPQSYV